MVILTHLFSFPHEDFFTTQDTAFFVSGNKTAFHTKYPDYNLTDIVSLKAFLCRCTSANSFPRH